MTPRKSEWMELAENDGSTRDVRKINKRLTLGTFAAVSAIIIGGSLFANANNEPVASAEVAVSSPIATSTPSSAPALNNPAPQATATKVQAPAIASLPQVGKGERDDHEGREGPDGRGEHRDNEESDD